MKLHTKLVAKASIECLLISERQTNVYTSHTVNNAESSVEQNLRDKIGTMAKSVAFESTSLVVGDDGVIGLRVANSDEFFAKAVLEADEAGPN